MNINVMNVYKRGKKGKDKKAFYPIRSRLIYSMGLVNAICGIEVILSYIHSYSHLFAIKLNTTDRKIKKGQ